jgi:flavin-dependent dehydrogenase
MTATDETFDVVVVGASFAGLSFASAAAVRGLRVLVLERDTEIGGVVRTTGVLFSDVLDWLDVPERYLLNSIRGMRLVPPSGEPLAISARVQAGGIAASRAGALRGCRRSHGDARGAAQGRHDSHRRPAASRLPPRCARPGAPHWRRGRLCGAATGGGIYPALISGRLAAHAVANEALNGAEGAVRA